MSTDELIVSLAAVFLLLLISAFFAAAETGLTAASRARMRHLEEAGNKRAGLVNRLRSQKEGVIGTILLGNNLVNISASALATSVMIAVYGDAGIAYATVVMTALVVIFTEVLPKTYAIQHPDRMAMTLAQAVRFAVWLLWPLTKSVHAIVTGILKLAGESPTSSQRLISAAEEIRSSISLYAEEGALVKHERDMLGSIFDLADVVVAHIMVHRRNMQTIDAALPPAEILLRALASAHTRVPLWRDNPDNIVGILNAKDLLRAIAAKGGSAEGIDVAALATAPWFVPETTTLREQLIAFRERQKDLALVVDEYGTLQGLVTLRDILEEIVGDIRDEHDRARARADISGTVIADGTMPVRDINRQFDWSLPDDLAATIAGLVIHEARQIPDVGQAFIFHGFKFEVLRRKRNQITTLRITPLATAAAAPLSGQAA
jgi:Mg2+/Co2+ transporter CorB